MDDLLKQLFPIGKTRWIKVKYLDYDKIIKWMRLHGRGPNAAEHLGIEVHAIGCLDDYTPQIKALVELKKEFEHEYHISGLHKDPVDLLNRVVDHKIEVLLQEITIQ